jgi:hypothetical protein
MTWIFRKKIYLRQITSIVNAATRLDDDAVVVFFGVFIGHFGVVKPAR